MDIFGMILVVLGLSLFEAINSIDNAIINADMLRSVSARAKRWFLSWGLLFAVFVVRGLVPWLVVWLSTPGLSISGAFLATLHADPSVRNSIESAAPALLFGSGIFLLLLYLHWLLHERAPRASHKPVSFFLASSLAVVCLAVIGASISLSLFIAALVGSLAFFVCQGLRDAAAGHASRLSNGEFKDVSKLAALELIDMTFSIDGVLGAFAFTLSVPLILVGNSLGALVVRQLTVRNAAKLHHFAWMKRAAMLSILCLSLIMITTAFGVPIPKYASLVSTALIVLGYGIHNHHSKKHSVQES